MKTDLFLSLLLTGDAMQPDEITVATGIVPDEATAKGARKPRQNLPRQNIWSIRSASPADDVASHWATLLPRIEPGLEELAAVSRDLTVSLTIVVHASERLPPVLIPADMMATLARLGALIDIDCYQ